MRVIELGNGTVKITRCFVSDEDSVDIPKEMAQQAKNIMVLRSEMESAGVKIND